MKKMNNDDIRQEAELIKLVVARAGKKVRHKRAVWCAKVRFYRRAFNGPRGGEQVIFFQNNHQREDIGFMEKIVDDVCLSKMGDKLEPFLKETLEMLMAGYSQKDIADILGRSEAAISLRVKTIQNVFKDMLLRG